MLTNNGLKDKPQSIFNADEIKTLYSKISRSSTVTIIAAGNVLRK